MCFNRKLMAIPERSHSPRNSIFELTTNKAMIKRIYFARHGETDCNKQNLIQGKGIDAPLNQLGHRQAQAFYDHYHHIPFDRVYTTSLQRTRQSMAPLIASGVPHETNPGFDEMNFGIMEGQPMFDEQGQFALEWLLTQWRNGDGDAKVEKGESPNEVMDRIAKALDQVIARTDETNVVVCMHGRAIRVLLCYLLGEPISQMEHHPHNNLGVSLFEYSYDTEKYTPIFLASYEHLEKLSM